VRTLELQSGLPKVAGTLLHLFPKADRCFVIQAEGERLIPRAVMIRRAFGSDARFSRALARKSLDEAEAFLCDKDIDGCEFPLHSVMCAPLCRADGKAFGVIQLDTEFTSKPFSQDDLHILRSVADQVAVSMENARLLDEAVRQERLQRDLQLAKQVQVSFLPSKPPGVPGYEFWGHSEIAREVGGDYYGFIPLPDGRVFCAVGDVAGKGVAASLIMAKLSSEIRFCAVAEPEPRKAIARLNESLCPFTGPMERFVTLAIAVLDPATHVCTLVNCGLGMPLLWRPSSGEVVEAMPKKSVGVPLGIAEGQEFDSCQLTLQPDESLILFTDGIDESMSVRGEKFTFARVKRIIQAAGRASPQELGEKLLAAVKQHCEGRVLHDDLAIVALRRE
jgi:serine phosphatase RsbU (regulator of sigma subunit)